MRLQFRLQKKNKCSNDTSSFNSLEISFGWAGDMMSLGTMFIWMIPPEGLISSNSYLKPEDEQKISLKNSCF